MDVVLDGKLAYWVGIVQSDGCFTSYYNKKKKYRQHYVSFGVAERSLPILAAFRDISQEKFDRTTKIHKRNNREMFDAKISVNKLLTKFKELELIFADPPRPPRWIYTNKKLFGAYLAGIIDGDGDVRIKRPKYPQCAVRISNQKCQLMLRKYVQEHFNCIASLNKRTRETKLGKRKIIGSWWELEFYVSGKNKRYISEYVLPWLRINHKKEKLERHIQ